MYPIVEINLNNIIDNAKRVKSLCCYYGISLSLIVKVLANNKKIVKSIVKSGIDCIGDSRIENLISYKNIKAEKWLITIPMISDVPNVIKYADVSLNSEISVIRKLNEEAKKQRKKHKIILMYELGDLREGCFKDELEEILKEALTLKNIEVYGIGTNLSCYGEILPTKKNMKEFTDVIKELEQKFNIKFKIISGGNSSSYKMLKQGLLPKKINNLRLGESIFLGNIPCIGEKITELHKNNFILKAEIIELKEKPSIPWGVKGKENSFGEHCEYVDRGIRKRAIVAIGRQDMKIESLEPVDKDIIVVYGSSDYILLDVTDSPNEYHVGDVVEFNLNYAGVLRAMTSEYVKRKIV